MTTADIGNASLREQAGSKWSPAMRRVNRRLAFSVAAAALLAAVTACSADPPGESEPELQPFVIEDMRSFSLPLDEYRVNQTNLKLYSAANDLLVRRCMARFGFELPVEPRTDIPTAGPPLTEHERRYGLADALSAARYGYHLAPALLAQPSTPTISHGAGKMAAAFDSVALGSVRRHDGQTVPDGGCLGEAKRQLRNGVPPGAEFLAERLVSHAYEAMLTDSRVVAASAAWSVCMKGHGHHYTRWQDATNDPSFQASETTEREIAVAVADVKCKKDVNFILVCAQVEVAYQQRLIDDNQAALDDVREHLDRMESAAARVLAEKAQPALPAASSS